MKKHFSYQEIGRVKKNILEILIENEKDGLSFSEIMDKLKEEKELILSVLDELLNYSCLVTTYEERYYFRA